MSTAQRQVLFERAKALAADGQVEAAVMTYKQAGAVREAVQLLLANQRPLDAGHTILEHLGLPLRAELLRPQHISTLKPEERPFLNVAMRCFVSAKAHEMVAELKCVTGDRPGALEYLHRVGEHALAASLEQRRAVVVHNPTEVAPAVSTRAIRIEAAGDLNRAYEAYVRSGNLTEAAGVAHKLGKLEDAYRLYMQAGRGLLAADMALELGKPKLALDQLRTILRSDKRYRVAATKAISICHENNDLFDQKVDTFLEPFIQSGAQTMDEGRSLLDLAGIYHRNNMSPFAVPFVQQTIDKFPGIFGGLQILEALNSIQAQDREGIQRVVEENEQFRAVTDQPRAQPFRDSVPGFGALPDLPDLPDLPPAPGASAPPQAAAPAAPAAQPTPPPPSTYTQRILQDVNLAHQRSQRSQPHTHYNPHQPHQPHPYGPNVPAPGYSTQAYPGQAYPSGAGYGAPPQGYDPPQGGAYPLRSPQPPHTPHPQGPPAGAPPVQPVAHTVVDDSRRGATEDGISASGATTVESSEWSGLETGSVIASRYELQRKLGEGGMAIVYQAHDRMLEDEVALKVFLTQITDETMLKRFVQELRLTRKLQHQNIIQYYDIGAFMGHKYISMELLNGRDMNEWMGEPLPIATGIRWIVQACRGLQFAHDKGIVHRDVKPHNIFVCDNDVIKVMDFGIAKQQSTNLTTDNMIAGTPDYMSPEQIHGFSTVTSSTDIYALGIILFEMFTGKLPYSHEETVPLLLMHVNDPIPDPRSINPEIPPSIADLTMRLMSKDADDRPSSCNEIIKELSMIWRELGMGR